MFCFTRTNVLYMPYIIITEFSYADRIYKKIISINQKSHNSKVLSNGLIKHSEFI